MRFKEVEGTNIPVVYVVTAIDEGFSEVLEMRVVVDDVYQGNLLASRFVYSELFP